MEATDAGRPCDDCSHGSNDFGRHLIFMVGGSSCRLSRSHFGLCVFVSDFGKMAGITAASFTKDSNLESK